MFQQPLLGLFQRCFAQPRNRRFFIALQELIDPAKDIAPIFRQTLKPILRQRDSAAARSKYNSSMR